MEVVNLLDDGETRNQTAAETVRVHMGRGGVEEDHDGVPEQGPGAQRDQEDDDQGEDGVQVVPVLPVSQPDDRGADEDQLEVSIYYIDQSEFSICYIDQSELT